MSPMKYASSFIAIFGLLLQASLAATAGTSQKPVTVKVQLVPYLGSAPFFIGDEEGYFSEQGLQIEFVKMVRSANGIAALAQSKLDVVYGGMSVGFLNAMARGAKIRFVAEKGYIPSTDCGYIALLARRVLIEEGKLNSASQLRGRRIYINPVIVNAYYVEKLLNTVGVSLDDLKIIDIPTSVMPEAFEKGTIDLASTTEPWVTRLVQAGHAAVWMPVQKVIQDLQLAAVLYGPTFLEKDPETGKRFMAGYLKAVRQYNQGKTARNLDILTKYTGLDRKLLTQACWPALRNDGKINIESMLDFQKWAVKKGFLDKVVSSQQFWDPSFLEYANGFLGGPMR